ncbi:MAG: chemotaxis protein CheB [Verrucomicrobiota bacterium]
MKRNIIVIGASAGGVEAVPRLLGSLRADIQAAIFVSLHIAPYNESVMPQLISRAGRLPAQHALHGMAIRPGMVYVAPPDHHLLVGPDVIELSHGPKENRHRPAIDPMFRTAAQVYGNRVAGVLLTGNLDDGVSGLQIIKENQGLTIVQDPAEAPFPQMPRNALEAFKPDHVLKLKQIENLLARLPNSPNGGGKMKKRARPTPQPLQTGAVPTDGEPAPLVCPECHGPLWEIRNGELVRYQCLVGHRYSLDNLLAGHAEGLEAALWTALRALEERVVLQRRLADQCRAAGRKSGERMFQQRLIESEKHARTLRTILEKCKL